MAEQSCQLNQMKNEEWICEKKDMDIKLCELKQNLKSKDQELFYVISQKQEEKERSINQISKMNELVNQLKLELKEMREQLEENEEYTTRLEEKVKK